MGRRTKLVVQKTLTTWKKKIAVTKEKKENKETSDVIKEEEKRTKIS